MENFLLTVLKKWDIMLEALTITVIGSVSIGNKNSN